MSDEPQDVSRRGFLRAAAGTGAAAMTLVVVDGDPASASTDSDVDGADADGPAVGTELPPPTVEILQESRMTANRTDWVAVFLSTSCVPCAGRASEIVQWGEGLDRTIFLVSGANPKGLERLQNLFDGRDIAVVYDPRARDVVTSVDINSTPFAFRVSGREVTGKKYLRSVNDFADLLEVHVSGGSSAVTNTREGDLVS